MSEEEDEIIDVNPLTDATIAFNMGPIKDGWYYGVVHKATIKPKLKKPDEKQLIVTIGIPEEQAHVKKWIDTEPAKRGDVKVKLQGRCVTHFLALEPDMKRNSFFQAIGLDAVVTKNAKVTCKELRGLMLKLKVTQSKPSKDYPDPRPQIDQTEPIVAIDRMVRIKPFTEWDTKNVKDEQPSEEDKKNFFRVG